MKKTMKNIAISGSVLVGSIVIMGVLMGMRTAPERKGQVDVRPVVDVMEVQNESIQLSVPVIGKLTAHEKVTIYAEVSGLLETTRNDFLAGYDFEKGELMLATNSADTEMSFKAQRSSWMTAVASLLPELKFDYPDSYTNQEPYLNNFAQNKSTQPLPEPENERESYFVANRGIATTYYNIKSKEIRLDKYFIRAPFDGTVTESYIKPGNLVRNGQALGVYINPDSYDLEVTVSLEEVKHISVGNQVKLWSTSLGNQWTGTVSRISEAVDNASQMVKVFISVAGSDLREGIYLEGEIQSSQNIEGMIIPRRMLEGGNTVYQVQDGIIVTQLVQVVATRGEDAIVAGMQDGTTLSTRIQGLEQGTLVLLEGQQNKLPLNLADRKPAGA